MSRRPTPSTSWRYNDAAWKANRAAFLLNNPTCALCPAQAVVADHHPTSRRQLIDDGVSDPDAWTYLRPLCLHHHATETAVNQPGGWNRPQT